MADIRPHVKVESDSPSVGSRLPLADVLHLAAHLDQLDPVLAPLCFGPRLAPSDRHACSMEHRPTCYSTLLRLSIIVGQAMHYLERRSTARRPMLQRWRPFWGPLPACELRSSSSRWPTSSEVGVCWARQDLYTFPGAPGRSSEGPGQEQARQEDPGAIKAYTGHT